MPSRSEVANSLNSCGGGVNTTKLNADCKKMTDKIEKFKIFIKNREEKFKNQIEKEASEWKEKEKLYLKKDKELKDQFNQLVKLLMGSIIGPPMSIPDIPQVPTQLIMEPDVLDV